MHEEYDLTILDLVEGEEYSLYRSNGIFRIKNKKLEVNCDLKTWGISEGAWTLNKKLFKKIVKKEKETFYRHFYKYRGEKKDATWGEQDWNDFKKFFMNPRDLQHIHTDSREF